MGVIINKLLYYLSIKIIDVNVLNPAKNVMEEKMICQCVFNGFSNCLLL